MTSDSSLENLRKSLLTFSTKSSSNTGVKDLTFLWINCRQVSRNFKEAVERVFVIKHLKKTWILIDPSEWYSEDHGKVFLASEFKFPRIDPTNPSRAI
ncbi:hypothetical protein EDD18DRAFT_379479 [Armillaria luteobubalina]|uniref:Uncharacterized protein n=1 Tax=Armillaria luteobubalina TaxID=153913 RepID=A0AA39Q3A3_9AGAR|nr:hypothetical protein EDD18DRAFT_379479 [Armillaria luteobubalina]